MSKETLKGLMSWENAGRIVIGILITAVLIIRNQDLNEFRSKLTALERSLSSTIDLKHELLIDKISEKEKSFQFSLESAREKRIGLADTDFQQWKAIEGLRKDNIEISKQLSSVLTLADQIAKNVDAIRTDVKDLRER